MIECDGIDPFLMFFSVFSSALIQWEGWLSKEWHSTTVGHRKYSTDRTESSFGDTAAPLLLVQ